MRCSNLLRHRQGFEMGIKDCVLTKAKQVFFFLLKVESLCLLLPE